MREMLIIELQTSTCGIGLLLNFLWVVFNWLFGDRIEDSSNSSSHIITLLYLVWYCFGSILDDYSS